MIDVQVNATGLEMRLGGLFRGLSDLRPAWRDIHQIFMDFMKAVFRAEGAYGGPRWVPLNPSYAAWKRRRFPGKTILQLRGTLYRSFTRASAPGHIYRTGPSFMETGSSIRYARAHHFGYPPRRLPARPIIREFTRAEGEMVVDALMAHLFKSMRMRGRR